jgi:OOP family OmpA-OmpF porin
MDNAEGDVENIAVSPIQQEKKMKTRKIAALVFLSAASTVCLAADPGFYVAVDAGQSHASDACSGLPAGFSCSNHATALRLTGGYQFMPALAVELAYGDFGKWNTSGSVAGIAVNGDAKGSGLEVSAVGTLHMNSGFSVFGRVGVASTSLKVSASGGGYSDSQSATSTTFAAGVGLRYDFSREFGLRMAYDSFGKVGNSSTTGTSNLDTLTVGLIYNF